MNIRNNIYECHYIIWNLIKYVQMYPAFISVYARVLLSNKHSQGDK